MFSLMWYSLLSSLWRRAEGVPCRSFLKSINMGIHGILESRPSPCTANKKDVGQTLEWVKREGKIKKEESEASENGSQFFHVLPVLSLSLPHKGLLREICRLWFFIEFWIGPIGGICLHKRKTFGLGLSKAQTSMSQLSAAACQRCSFLPTPNWNWRARSCRKSNPLCFEEFRGWCVSCFFKLEEAS